MLKFVIYIVIYIYTDGYLYFNTSLKYKVIYPGGTLDFKTYPKRFKECLYISTWVALNETKLERYFYKLPLYLLTTL